MIHPKRCNDAEDFEGTHQHVYLQCCYTNFVRKSRGKWTCDSGVALLELNRGVLDEELNRNFLSEPG